MSFELARSDVVTAALAAKAAWVGPPSPLVLEFQNVTVIDLDRQTTPYVGVEIHFLDERFMLVISAGREEAIDVEFEVSDGE